MHVYHVQGSNAFLLGYREEIPYSLQCKYCDMFESSDNRLTPRLQRYNINGEQCDGGGVGPTQKCYRFSFHQNVNNSRCAVYNISVTAILQGKLS